MFIELKTVKLPIKISTTLQFNKSTYNFRKKKFQLHFLKLLFFKTEYINNKSTVKTPMKKSKASNTVKCTLGHVLTKHCTQVTCRDKGVHQMWMPNMFVIVTLSYLVGVHLRTPPVVQVIL